MFNRAWLAGGIPRTACVAAYEPICAVSLADSYINRANPGTYDAAPGTAPTWEEATGWGFTVAGATYLSTGIIPANGYSMIARFSGAANTGAQSNWMMGVDHASNARFYMSPTWNAAQRLHGSGDYLITSGVYASGVMAIAGQKTYYNGAPDTADIGAWTTSQTREIKIGALNNVSGSAQYYFEGKIQALYIYNVTLTPAQVRAVTDAMNMLPMRPRVPAFPSWMRGAALTQFRKLLGLRTGSRGVSE